MSYDVNKTQLLTRKGIFPYEYLDSRSKLNETQLPPKEKFYSTLNDSHVSDEDYRHAQTVWSAFNCQYLYEYVYLYMKTDILLLADVFENFRDQCLIAYELDPAYYYTTPGLSWDAILKYTNEKLELLTDIDMVMFVESGIRGGISQCSNRYAHANNLYMKNYNKNEDSSYIVYLDANNLYGWAMIQALPYGGFEWVNDVDRSFNYNIGNDSNFGYILEVDLEYPHDLHESHSDLPFCPEHSKPPGSKQEKLLTSLLPKQKYILHYRALQQAIESGLKLTQIHRVLKFKQSPWLKEYIDFNTKLRTDAKNEFEKNLFKLMNNAVYGKTMQNVRKRVDVKLVTKWEGRYGAEALISKPNFHKRAIFNENLVAVELNKTEVLMNKPIYIGLSVLDISKTLMYDFHYKYMRNKYGKNCKLLYTDTDSLIYKIKCTDIYSDMKADICKFDTSDYPADNIYGIPQANKKVLGLMKDECNGRIITEFVGLRSKMYSIRVDGEDFMKKANGVKTVVVKKSISFDDYMYCLKNIKIQTRVQYSIRSKLDNVHTLKQTKIALSPFDDKRYLLENSTDTLAWGHYKIKNDENDCDNNDVVMLEV
ncbi:DNA polymerase-like [Leptopilina heterotoma]|uniref:DNA polymerase-like n=1 Tax=Leptopilina heterotoma TaxID=63436 RepID=UPI001CA880C4|nr:DNA polymerase-like [Leptopilina heterotoma]